MTLHRLTAGTGYQYLLRHTAVGDGERSASASLTTYYTASGNPPGRWMGSGLGGLGSGAGIGVGARVEEEPMVPLFGSGCDPLTGAVLGRSYAHFEPVSKRVDAQVAALATWMDSEAHQAAKDTIARVELARSTPKAVAGFDLTFTPPKSVSTLWAVADDRTQTAVLGAHRAAVGQALRFLEDRALCTRTGVAGCRQERTRGAVAVAFDHWDSRLRCALPAWSRCSASAGPQVSKHCH